MNNYYIVYFVLKRIDLDNVFNGGSVRENIIVVFFDNIIVFLVRVD